MCPKFRLISVGNFVLQEYRFICNIDIQATGVRYVNTVLPQSTEHSINRTILSVARSSNAHLCTEIIPDYTGVGLGRFHCI